MRSVLCIAAALFIGDVFSVDIIETATAQSQRYPRVYGPTGRPYGPTQADYQYRRQYGRDWHGYGGINATGSGRRGNVRYNYSLNLGGSSFGYRSYPRTCNYGGWGLPAWSYQSYQVWDPIVVVPQGYVGGNYVSGVGPYVDPYVAYPQNTPGIQNPALLDTLRENDERWNGQVGNDVQIVVRKPIKPSTPEAQLKSLKYLGQGDVYLRKLEYSKAASRYKSAATAANDLAPPRFHRGIALLGLGRYTEAINEFREGLRRDPSWPHDQAASFDSILGEENITAKQIIKSRVLDWTKDDIRDPDKLFLMGVVLYLDNDEDRAKVLFETAATLGGMTDYLAAYLKPQKAEVAENDVILTVPDPTLPADLGEQQDGRNLQAVPKLPTKPGKFPVLIPPQTESVTPKPDSEEESLVLPPLPQ